MIQPRDDVRSGSTSRGVRMDMHCHSRASSKPVNRVVGALTRMPECYSPPEKVYDQARARGMDLVTITDHDTIAGAIELHERGFEGFVIGQEVSVVFPEDGCLLHVLVWGLTPNQADELDRSGLRGDVYAFAHWLHRHNLPHSLAHPLYIQNGRLTDWHIERALLLFRAFETLNGAHSATHRSGVEAILKNLTPKRIQDLSATHGIKPVWSRSWLKGVTGGSDDHGLLNIGRTYTAVELAQGEAPLTTGEFLRRVMAGQSMVGGVGGHSALLAHQLATVTANWYARRIAPKSSARGRYVASKMVRFAGVESKKPAKPALLLGEARRKLRLRRAAKGSRLAPILSALRSELGPVLARYPELRDNLEPSTWGGGSPFSQHDRMAEFADELTTALTRAMGSSAVAAARGKDKDGMIAHLTSYGVLTLAQLPYIFSLFHQNKERMMIERINHEHSTPGDGVSATERPMRVLQFTDTLGDVNGVARFIRNMAEQAHATGHDLTVVTSTKMPVPDLPTVRNFEPVVAMKMPKYDALDAVLPPLMSMLRWAERQRPDVIHVSTPGAVGFVGFLAAKILRVPLVGTYHTDFPSYINKLFDDQGLTKVTEIGLKAFYHSFATVLSRSDEFVPFMEQVGIHKDRIGTLISGIDRDAFGSRFADRSIWKTLGIDPEIDTDGKRLKVLYCGRVSVEKNLPLTTKIWKRVSRQLETRGIHADLVLVGDGPYRKQMELELKGMHAHFLGFKHGEELATLYASSDLFLFPSITDTLGQVVMEAQASGLPAIVSDIGGPKTIVRDGESGYVLPVGEIDPWVNAILELATKPEHASAMRDGAIRAMQGRDIRDSFLHFWQVHQEAWDAHLAKHGIRDRYAPKADQPDPPRGASLSHQATASSQH